MKSALRFFFVLLLASALSAPHWARAAAPPCSISVDDARSILTVTWKNKPVLVYAFARGQFKPYVRELYTLSGINVLLDAPADHLHHHGLMYAIRVNDINFWEETGEAGHEVPVQLLPPRTGRSTAGLPQATFTQILHWVAHTNAARPDTAAAALLIETRTIRITIDEARDEVALEWMADFEVGRPATGAVKLTGSAYNGLGLRLPKDFDRVARHRNSEDAPYTTEGKADVTVARWSAVSGKAGGQTASLALFGHPANAGETRFFTMVNPFTYLSVTQNLEKQPLEYTAAQRFALRYLLTASSKESTRDALHARFTQWTRGSQ